ncbi:unnamed protein product [Cuscuta campestris]|uniref:Uncharacterized protein n=1 Tax=Cuscuta campestris TaxID=132261 RepID=A0A484NGH1_9ASTE|nr:unnamed protein product [Cuscuta campestris]
MICCWPRLVITKWGECGRFPRESVAALSRRTPLLGLGCWKPSEDILFFASAEDIYSYDGRQGGVRHWRRNRWGVLRGDAVTADGRNLICGFEPDLILIWDLWDPEVGYRQLNLKGKRVLRSICLSQESGELLVNLNSQQELVAELVVLDISREMREVKRYTCHESRRGGVMSPCFGGFLSRFIVSGSFNGKVYIWSREYHEPVEVLSGHTDDVLSVTWNPKVPTMLASGSDDGCVRIWGPAAPRRERKISSAATAPNS